MLVGVDASTSMSADRLSLDTETLAGPHYAAIVLAAITGVIHLLEAIPAWPGALGISFLLAGLGFLGGIILFLLGWKRRLLYLIAIPYTGIQLPLYVVFNWPDIWRAIGVFDKLVQIALIILVIYLWRTET